MMDGRTKTILLGLILLCFIAFGARPLWTGAGKYNTDVPQTAAGRPGPGVQETGEEIKAPAPKLAELLDNSFAAGKPVAVVYTYSSDC